MTTAAEAALSTARRLCCVRIIRRRCWPELCQSTS